MSYLAYTYLIKCPNGKSYYGYRAANQTSPEDDLWKHYFTSSKVIQELREQYGDDQFIATIDKTFATAEEAYEYETKFLKENDCARSDEWVNQACFPMYNMTEETKKKMSESHKGMKLSKEHARNISEGLKGWAGGMKGKNHSEESKKKLSDIQKGSNNSFYGKKHSEETKKKMREASKGRKHTEETKKKLREAAARRRKNKQKD